MKNNTENDAQDRGEARMSAGGEAKNTGGPGQNKKGVLSQACRRESELQRASRIATAGSR